MSGDGQRWVRPLDVEPGHWKKQLPGKSLRYAAKGKISDLKALLAAEPQMVDRRGPHGRTLLWEAARAGRDEAVRYLVQQGANVGLTGCYNSESHVQLTPYCAAVYYRRPVLASFLAQRSAEPDIFRAAFLGAEDSVLRQVVADHSLLAAEDPYDEVYFMPIVAFAVAGGHKELVEGLVAQGAEIEAYSALLLFLSAKATRQDLMELLVEAGADPSCNEAALIATKDIGIFRRLLELQELASGGAVQRGMTLHPFLRGDRPTRPDKIAALLDHGVPIDARDEEGNTALHLACRRRRWEVVALLLERGANPAQENIRGLTPLHIAQIYGQRDIVSLLKQG